MGRENRKQRTLNNKILIVCQGITEFNYFNSIRISLGKLDVKLSENTEHDKIIPRICDENPKKVVNLAIKCGQKDEYRSIWCVFDKDNFNDFDEAIKLAKENNISCAYSNKDFELWFLMHIRKCVTPISDTNCKKELSKYLDKKYEKTDEKLYEDFKDKTKFAINNSKIVHETWRKDKVFQKSQREPCTTVYKLVEELMKWE